MLLDEETANAYNRVCAAFYQAQTDYEMANGAKWTPDRPLTLSVEKEDLEVWNSMAGVLEALNKFNQFHPVDYGQPTEDFLIPLD